MCMTRYGPCHGMSHDLHAPRLILHLMCTGALALWWVWYGCGLQELIRRVAIIWNKAYLGKPFRGWRTQANWQRRTSSALVDTCVLMD